MKTDLTIAAIGEELWGYYVDTKRELGSTYTVARNQMTNGELDEAI